MFWERFWNEYSKSTITSGILALLIWGIIGYLAIMGMDLPDALTVGGGSIIGYFFAAKSAAQSVRASRDREVERLRAAEKDCDCSGPLCP